MEATKPDTTLDSRDKAFLDYLKKAEEALRKLLEELEDRANRIRRPNDPE